MEGMFMGTAPEMIKIKGKLWLTREEWKRSIGPIWRGGIIGFVIGVLPARGTIASIMSYTTEKRLSKHPEEFGHGAIEGVAGPESANNSDTAGALVPLLTLGVPGGGATAVLLGAFIILGSSLARCFSRTGPISWGLINSIHRQHHAGHPESAADRYLREAALHTDGDPVSAHHRDLRDRRMRSTAA